jgi:hypothetical protein
MSEIDNAVFPFDGKAFPIPLEDEEPVNVPIAPHPHPSDGDARQQGQGGEEVEQAATHSGPVESREWRVEREGAGRDLVCASPLSTLFSQLIHVPFGGSILSVGEFRIPNDESMTNGRMPE